MGILQQQLVMLENTVEVGVTELYWDWKWEFNCGN